MAFRNCNIKLRKINAWLRIIRRCIAVLRRMDQIIRFLEHKCMAYWPPGNKKANPGGLARSEQFCRGDELKIFDGLAFSLQGLVF